MSCTAGFHGGAGVFVLADLSLENTLFTGNSAFIAGSLWFQSKLNPPYAGTNIRGGTAFINNRGGLQIDASITWECALGLWMPLIGKWQGDITNCTELCFAGTFGVTNDLTTPTCSGPCPIGHFCDAGTIDPSPCRPGTYMPGTGATSHALCLPCAPGDFQSDSGATACRACEVYIHMYDNINVYMDVYIYIYIYVS